MAVFVIVLASSGMQVQSVVVLQQDHTYAPLALCLSVALLSSTAVCAAVVESASLFSVLAVLATSVAAWMFALQFPAGADTRGPAPSSRPRRDR